MPKIKTHKGAAKRFKRSGSGKIRRFKAFSNHLFLTKSGKRKRRLRKGSLVDSTNLKRVNRLLAK
ncbi:MAG: 50S ribosomal protein L35 [Candidatus Poribacteria bacterium]|nr:50S ribosomal protein L35 [Candidatus Poribacteria bacterium]